MAHIADFIPYLAKKHLLEIRLPLHDSFYTYWGKPIYGGVFGAGEWALVGQIDPRYTLATVHYSVVHVRSGLPLNNLCQTKAEAIGSARDRIRTLDMSHVYTVIAGLMAQARALETRLAEEEKQQRIDDAAARQEHVRERDKAGYVYLIRCDELYKIGKAGDVEVRLRSMTLPSKPEVVATCHFEKPYVVENSLHKEFKHCRENGEWFRLKPAEVDKVKARLAKQNKPKLKAV